MKESPTNPAPALRLRLEASLDPEVELSSGSGRQLPAEPLHQAVAEPGLLSGVYFFDFTASMENNATAVSGEQQLPLNLKRKRSRSDSYNPLFH